MKFLLVALALAPGGLCLVAPRLGALRPRPVVRLETASARSPRVCRTPMRAVASAGRSNNISQRARRWVSIARYAPAYYAVNFRRVALALALWPLVSILRRRRVGPSVPPSVCAALWQGSKGGGERLGPRCAYYLGASAREKSRIYAALLFDQRQRSPAVPPPSFLKFTLSTASAARGGYDDAEMSMEALRKAAAEGSLLMAAAFQRLPGNMAGEGKLLNIHHLIQRTLDLKVKGDVVELGCNQGATACLLRAVLAQTPKTKKTLHCYDSFEGLPAGDASKGDPPAYGLALGSMACSVRDLEENFELLGLKLPVVHKGWFSDTLQSKDNPSKISFAHLDGDLYSSILESLGFVYPRMPAGAICVLDDYCDPAILNRHDIFPGAKAACDEFFSDKPELVRILPAPHPGFDFPMQYETHAYFQKL